MSAYAPDITRNEACEVCGYVKRIPAETLRRFYFAILAEQLATDVEAASENKTVKRRKGERPCLHKN